MTDKLHVLQVELTDVESDLAALVQSKKDRPPDAWTDEDEQHHQQLIRLRNDIVTKITELEGGR